MVFELQLRNRLRPAALIAAGALLAAMPFSVARPALAQDQDAAAMLREAQSLYGSGQYFKSARYAFAAEEQDPSLTAEADARITLGLAHAGLYNASAFFFIKTLQSGNQAAIRRVLPETEELFLRVGPDLLRKYLIRHTTYELYDPSSRSAYLYSLGKEALLAGNSQRAIEYLNGVQKGSHLYPYSLQLKGTAHAILNETKLAIQDFEGCQDRAEDTVVSLKGVESTSERDRTRLKHSELEARNLKNRCIAGEARTQYQAGDFNDAEETYDHIPKSSLVWPDILFEQAWNAFAQQQYNRTLGKLVSYKSPALSFVFNPEIDVLRAQAYLALCLYSDANDVVNEFNQKYTKVGEEVKQFVESNASNLPAFYEQGKRALEAPLGTTSDFYRMENRFVRGPYFQNLVESEGAIASERGAVHQFDLMQAGVRHGGGFPAFLEQVLRWRLHTVQFLGGAFVKNSLIDYHSALIADFDKMSFIKLEMLSRAKAQLLGDRSYLKGERTRGNVEPERRDYQYFWSFNGEFWDDELGDYVFGLESKCKS